MIDVVEGVDGSRRLHPGGSCANVAVGLARLNRSCTLATRFGDDAYGRQLRSHLEASGVQLSPGAMDTRATSTATARLNSEGVAAYEFDLMWELGALDLRIAPLVLHAGSLGAFLEPGCATVAGLMGAVEGITVSYDPNVRPALMGSPRTARQRIEQLVGLSDVVKVSDEDLAWLAPNEDPYEVLMGWQQLGPALLVLTRGDKGASALNAIGWLNRPAPPADVVDTVGAGDAFTSGLLDALWRKDLLGAARRPALLAAGAMGMTGVLDHALKVAAVSVSRPGADPPWSHELHDSCDLHNDRG